MASSENEGFRNISPIPRATTMVEKSNLANSMPPETQTGIFNNLTVGVINHVFKVTEQGMWLGAEQFDDAPFSVTMDGVVTIGGYLSDAYLREGQAANDINTYATTISGAKITTGTITANKLSVTTLSSITANLGTINSGTINSITMNGSTVNTTTLNSSTINSTVINGGTINSATLNSNTINGGTINSTTLNSTTIKTSTLTGGSITSTSLSSSTITGTTITGGTINSTTINAGSINGSLIVLTRENNGATGYLTWVGGSRIWTDNSNNMGYRALGGYHYFYSGYNEKFVITPSGYQNVSRQGLICDGSLNVWGNGAITGYWNVSGASTIQGRLTLNTYAYFNAGMILTGTSQINAHINAWTNGNYNLGSSSSYWRYVNCYRVSEHSMTSFDSPVEMRDGRKLDDIEALKAIKTDKIIDETTGRPFLDKRSFPKDVLVPAYDQETGEPYKRDKNDRPLVPNKEGKLEPRPDADGIATGQMLSLLFGGFKQLNAKVEKLEQQSNKNVKI